MTATGFGPVMNCQAFVASVGMTINVAASTGGIDRLSRPRATVGSPMPNTPFTHPPQNRLSATNSTVDVTQAILNARRISRPPQSANPRFADAVSARSRSCSPH